MKAKSTGKAIMIQGTGSGVGKSFLSAGLCRIVSDMGLSVAPFKAQNMALNSFVTAEGGEIGRAQAFQAEAARVAPRNDMNPVLLKTQSESGCQVILNGRVHSSMTARQYYAFRETAWAAVTEAYDRLAQDFDVIVLEGAGSPAEINLAREDIVNMNMARHAGSPVLLVGDIDKGGVFASLYGTVALLNGDANMIKAFVINKFRGDKTILDPGLDAIRAKTGRPVIGVIPHFGELGMHEEDGIPADRMRATGERPVRIAVVRLRSISNFTDFDPFLYEPDVEIIYTTRESDIGNADLVILPGSKNTVKDLLRLRESGLDRVIIERAERGWPVAGICGGYQMLGRAICDPHGMESEHAEVAGLSLLDAVTTLGREKTTRQVTADVAAPPPGMNSSRKGMAGYEIHLGATEAASPLFRIITPDGADVTDGAAFGSVWGTYLHGIFDNDAFRRELINSLRARRGLEPLESGVCYAEMKDAAINRWADALRAHMNMEFIFRMMGIGG
jgi:adenosylcobyric acid synthase